MSIWAKMKPKAITPPRTGGQAKRSGRSFTLGGHRLSSLYRADSLIGQW